MERRRCDWAGDDPLYARYHDEEWGVPVHDDRQLFEMLNLEGAQAGLSWITILRKRENYRAAFDNFDAAKIAAYDEAKIAELLANPGIVRNRLKVRGVVKNAQAFLAVQEEFGSFRRLGLALRGRAAPGQPLGDPRPGPRADARVRRAQRRAQAAGLSLRRPHHLLRLHASRGHGQRPHRGLLPASAQRGSAVVAVAANLAAGLA